MGIVMVYLLVGLIGLETFFIYFVYKDILSPAVIFSFVFLISSINLLTNVYSIGIELNFNTVLVICGGILTFFVGTLFVGYSRKRIIIRTRKIARKIYMPKRHMIFMLIFNLFGIIYILYEVYSLTKQYAFYTGGVLGSLSVFAEVSKFGAVRLRVGTVSTFLSAFLEAEAYVLGFVITKNWVEKNRNSILLYFCFITSFLSTFCQGSRGGIFIIIALVVLYIFMYRKERGTKRISPILIKRVLLIVVIAMSVFAIAGAITGKNWSVSLYEYFSVYLGFPISNLNSAIQAGIPRTDIVGMASFSGLFHNILPRFDISIPSYSFLSKFLFLNGHNMGNVYTIYGSLIADYGYFGMTIVLVVIGAIMNILYTSANKSLAVISISQILYAYFLACVAFSFFSNKICENITVFHIYETIFAVIWIKLLTRKKDGNNKIQNY